MLVGLSRSNTGYNNERTTGDREGVKSQTMSKHRTDEMSSSAKPKHKKDKAASQAKPKLKVNEGIQSSPTPDSGQDITVPPPNLMDEVITPPPDFADNSGSPLSDYMDDVFTMTPDEFLVPPPDEFADAVISLSHPAKNPKPSDPCPNKPTRAPRLQS